jgi:alkylated DNA repair dioxygenase AlkB
MWRADAGSAAQATLLAAGVVLGVLATLAVQRLWVKRDPNLVEEELPEWLKNAEEELRTPQRKDPKSRSSTATIEACAPACSVCGSAPYLDASMLNCLRCPQCECAAASRGVAGTTDLGSGCMTDYLPQRLEPADGAFLRHLLAEVGWARHDDVLPDGTVVTQPRKIAYQASDATLVYSYEGISAPLVPEPFTPLVAELKAQVETLCGTSFNSAHLNLYSDGSEHVSWHTDEDVALYGDAPVIASLSFGATRDFVLRRMHGQPYTPEWAPVQPLELLKYALGDGDVLVMRGATQRHYEHTLLKLGRKQEKDLPAGASPARLNITFRRASRSRAAQA